MRSDLYSRTSRRTPAIAAAIALLPVAAVGCGGSEGAEGKAPRSPREALIQSACAGGPDKVLRMAVADYVKQATPKPQRFLNAAGTDSALPAVGVEVLQGKGPTYLFPGGAEAQARAMLHEKGDYTTLLVVPRPGTTAPRAATVRLGGYYVGGEEDGKPAGDRTYTFACDSAGWRMTNKAPERRA